MKFEQEYVRCVGNEKECVCSVCLSLVCLILATWNSGPPVPFRRPRHFEVTLATALSPSDAA